MTFAIHFTGCASNPQLTFKRHNMTIEQNLLSLFSCLKRMSPSRKSPRLRFILPNKARLDFHYFSEDDLVHIHYREPDHPNIYLGRINSSGVYNKPKLSDLIKNNISLLIQDLSHDFTRAIHTYGKNTHFCALCGQPLIDPSSLSRGVTLNCVEHLIPPADLEDI